MHESEHVKAVKIVFIKKKGSSLFQMDRPGIRSSGCSKNSAPSGHNAGQGLAATCLAVILCK
jgi:hypothetical protein